MEIISKYTSIIQVAITFNIAFIAIGYVKEYFYQLLDYLIEIEDKIDIFFERVNSLIQGGLQTLNELSPIKVGEGDSAGRIGTIKNKYENFQKTLTEESKHELKSHVKNICYIKNIPFYSVNLLLYNLLWLYFGAIESISFVDSKPTYWTYFIQIWWFFFSLLFVLSLVRVNFICTKKIEKINKTIIIYVILLVLSAFLGYVFYDKIYYFSYYDWGLKSFALFFSLAFFVFIVFLSLKVNEKTQKIKNLFDIDIKDKNPNRIKEQYYELQKELDDIKTFYSEFKKITLQKEGN